MVATETREQVCTNDQCFKNEPARRAYRMFCKYNVCEHSKSSFLSLGRVDAVMATIMDSLSTNHELAREKLA